MVKLDSKMPFICWFSNKYWHASTNPGFPPRCCPPLYVSHSHGRLFEARIEHFCSGFCMETAPSFTSKKKAKLFIAEQSVIDKKPFKVCRSDARRLEVFCPIAGCLFRTSVRARKDDIFYVAKSQHSHTCASITPTVKKSWLRSKISEQMAQRQSVTVAQLSDWFRLSFGLDVEQRVLEKCVRQVKNAILADNASFGIVRTSNRLQKPTQARRQISKLSTDNSSGISLSFNVCQRFPQLHQSNWP